MDFIQQIEENIRQYPDLIEAAGPPGDEQMNRAREHFTSRLPESLEKYLATFGKLAIPPEEFFGLSAADPEGKFHDDIVRMHRDLMAHHNMPSGYIPLLSENGDSYLVLIPGESGDVVIRWDPFHDRTRALEQTFPELLLERCEWLIEDETQEWTCWEERIANCRWFKNVGTGEIDGAERVQSWDEVTNWLAREEYRKAKDFSKSQIQREMKRWGMLPNWEAAYVEHSGKIDWLLSRSIVPAVREQGLPDVIVGDFRDHALLLLASFPMMGPDYDALGIVELYLGGYCPCGFQGRYPRGTLFVY